MRLPPPRLITFSQEHGNVIATILCGVLLFLGWLALHLEWVRLTLLKQVSQQLVEY